MTSQSIIDKSLETAEKEVICTQTDKSLPVHHNTISPRKPLPKGLIRCAECGGLITWKTHTGMATATTTETVHKELG